jgi:hypothetical protein
MRKWGQPIFYLVNQAKQISGASQHSAWNITLAERGAVIGVRRYLLKQSRGES